AREATTSQDPRADRSAGRPLRELGMPRLRRNYGSCWWASSSGLWRSITDLSARATVRCFAMRYLKTTEAAALLGVGPSTLRAWERRFDFPKPQRSLGGHRYYTH